MSALSAACWSACLGCGRSTGQVPSAGGDVAPPLALDAAASAEVDAPSPFAPDVAPASTPSPLGAVAREPASGAAGVCPDTRLALTFDGAVVVGASGLVRIFDAGAPSTPVDTIDVGAPYFNDTLGGRRFFTQLPVFVDSSAGGLDGARVTIAPHAGALAPNKSYFVTIDPGVLVDAAGRPITVASGPDDWRFTTRAAPAGGAALTVAADGSGDFCTVQAAVDTVPAHAPTPTTITLAPGLYREIVFIADKDQLTLRGADRAGSVIAYANNDALQNKLGTKYRAVVEAENVTDLVVENLTLHNLTPQGGSQAEALRVEPGDRVTLRDADFLSLQDTLLLTGRVYVTGATIEGNVDFIWGKGAAYVERSEIRTVVRPGYGVQARNPAGQYGYVFVDSKLTATPGLTGHLLARIDATSGTGYPASQVAYVDCQMGPHVDPRGWLVTPAGVDTSGVRFWEYHSTDATGTPVDVSKRDPASRQLTDAEAAMLRDKATVLGGWDPGP
jgi:pectin methylesterase-like acyl-CoA thioesterase